MDELDIYQVLKSNGLNLAPHLGKLLKLLGYNDIYTLAQIESPESLQDTIRELFENSIFQKFHWFEETWLDRSWVFLCCFRRYGKSHANSPWRCCQGNSLFSSNCTKSCQTRRSIMRYYASPISGLSQLFRQPLPREAIGSGTTAAALKCQSSQGRRNCDASWGDAEFSCR